MTTCSPSLSLPVPPYLPSSSASPSSPSLRVRLANEELWRRFNEKTTEMVVTKSGRKMFPKMEYMISGLDPTAQYFLEVHIERADDCRYKFVGGAWEPCSRGESTGEAKSSHHKSVPHQDSTQPGSSWMRGVVSFDRVKITNDPSCTKPSNICLTSMCRYQPVLTITRVSSSSVSSPPLLPFSSLHKFEFREKLCTFIAVTAYQNQSITNLKIEHNPFAKGFREGGCGPAADRKRRSSSSMSPSTLSEHSPKRQSPSGETGRPLHLPPPVTASLLSSPFTYQQQLAAAAAAAVSPPLSLFPLHSMHAFYMQLYALQAASAPPPHSLPLPHQTPQGQYKL